MQCIWVHINVLVCVVFTIPNDYFFHIGFLLAFTNLNALIIIWISGAHQFLYSILYSDVSVSSCLAICDCKCRFDRNQYIQI